MIKKTIFVYANNKPTSESSYEYYHIMEIDKMINGSIDEILCDCIDLVPFVDRPKLVTILLSKLKIDGTLILKCNDLYTLCKYIMNNKISIEQANLILGSSASITDDSYNEHILNEITNAKILDTLYDGFARTITLQRISK